MGISPELGIHDEHGRGCHPDYDGGLPRATNKLRANPEPSDYEGGPAGCVGAGFGTLMLVLYAVS